MQAAGHLSHTLTPRFVTTTRGTAVPATPQLQIKLSEKARSGNPNVNIFAKRGATQIGATTVDLQIDCNCRDTGAFVEPDVLAVKPSTSNLLSGDFAFRYLHRQHGFHSERCGADTLGGNPR